MNYQEAIDSISAVFYAAWNPTYPVKWEDLPGDVPSTETAWAKVLVQHTGGELSSLGGGKLLRKWHRDGVIVVQVFAPAGQGKTLAVSLGQTVVDAYQTANTEIQYRNVQLVEFGTDGAFYRVDIYANFDYDDVR